MSNNFTCQKTVSVYNIVLNQISFNELNSKNDSQSIRTILREAFCNGADYYAIPGNNPLNFEIIDFTDDYIFGTFGKEEKVLNAMTTLIDRSTRQAKILNPDDILEKYTYFYIDIKLHKISYINNKLSLNNALSKFINKTGTPPRLYFSAVVCDDPIKRFEDLNVTNIAFSINEPKSQDYRPLSYLDDEVGVETIHVKAKLKKTPITKITKLLSNKHNFKNLSISATNSVGREEIFDAIENSIKYKKEFTLSEDMEKNNAMIKEVLISVIKDINIT